MTHFDQHQLEAIATFLRSSDHARANMLQDLMCSAEDALRLLGRQAEVAEVVRSGQPLTPDHMAQLRTLIDSHETLAQGIRDALKRVSDYTHIQRDLAAIITRHLRIAKRQIDLAAILCDVERVIKVRFERVPCRLIISCKPVLLTGDADRLFRAIYVLLENSHGFVSTHRDDDDGLVEVHLSREAEAQRVLLVIEDNGPGIDPALLGHLGEPGLRGETDVPGPGLSLFFVKAVVEAHGGAVEFGPRADGGQGARVAISLPIDTVTGGAV